MTVDCYIFLTAIIRLFLFVLLQIFIFRTSKITKVVDRLIKIYILTVFLTVSLELAVKPIHIDIIIMTILSLAIFTFMTATYILGFFGMMMASLRLRLLSVIVQNGEEGINKREIFKKYNKESIVKGRIKRLLESGELIKKDSRFYIGKTFSVMAFHGYIYNLLKKFYSF